MTKQTITLPFRRRGDGHAALPGTRLSLDEDGRPYLAARDHDSRGLKLVEIDVEIVDGAILSGIDKKSFVYRAFSSWVDYWVAHQCYHLLYNHGLTLDGKRRLSFITSARQLWRRTTKPIAEYTATIEKFDASKRR